ncbi:MAG: serine hydrolase [Pseudomonadota bacterium]
MLRYLIALAMVPVMDDANAQSTSTAQTVQSTSEDPTPLEARARDLVLILNDEGDAEATFNSVFLQAFPPTQLAALSAQLTAQFGNAVGVEDLSTRGGTASQVTIRMERGLARFAIVLDPSQDSRIGGLRLLGVTPIGDTIERITSDLRSLDGEVSAFFGPIDGNSGKLAINPQTQRPLGSAMKLYVLGALGEEIAQGLRGWDDVVTLDRKSFPSGQMQDWPEGSPVTLHTLASLMISISDNTATDALIRLLGRERMTRYLEQTAHSQPERNAPWLTTRELFLLKGGPKERIASFSSGSLAERERILARIEDNPPTLGEINAALAAGPVAIDTIEWFANTSDLARLFARMRAASDPEVFRILQINKGIDADIAAAWDYVGYKGGSETGVLNMTWLLQDASGRDRILTLSWSNTQKPVKTETLLLIAQRLLSLTQ